MITRFSFSCNELICVLGTALDFNPDKARTLFGDNYPRLQKLKKQYDPDMVFNRWWVIAPAN